MGRSFLTNACAGVSAWSKSSDSWGFTSLYHLTISSRLRNSFFPSGHLARSFDLIVPNSLYTFPPV